MLSDIIETASSLHIRGFSGGQKEEQLGENYLSQGSRPRMFCLSVVDPQLDLNHDKFQNVRTYNTGRTTKALTRKSDGRKSSAPKKLAVLEDENVGENPGENMDGTRYSILGSYLNSCKTQGQTLTTNTDPSDLPEVGSSGKFYLNIIEYHGKDIIVRYHCCRIAKFG